MKKLYFTLLALAGILFFYSFIVANGGINLPGYLWTSGEVRTQTIADKNAFNLNLTLPEFKEGDKVKITFGSYKVTLTGITPETTFNRWAGKVNLVYKVNDKWILMVSDANDRINKLFTNISNNPSDSLINYSFTMDIPKDGHLTITVAPQSFELDHIDGHGKPMFTHGYTTVTTTIRGLKVEKL